MRKYIPEILAWLVAIVSVVVIIGWFFDISILKRILPGFVTMKFTTAVSFLVSSMILMFSSMQERKSSDWGDVMLPAATMVISILMGTQLLSSLFNFKSGIEDLFVSDSLDALLTVVPGRPSIGTMTAFVVVSFLGLVAIGRRNLRSWFYLIGGILLISIGLLAVAGYVLSMPLLYYLISDFSSAMAVHTALLLIILGSAYTVLFYVRKKSSSSVV